MWPVLKEGGDRLGIVDVLSGETLGKETKGGPLEGRRGVTLWRADRSGTKDALSGETPKRGGPLEGHRGVTLWRADRSGLKTFSLARP